MNDEDRQRQQLDDERRRDDQRRQDELRRQGTSGDAFTIDPYTDAFLCLKGLPRKAVTCPDIQLNGPLEFLSGVATLRSADLVAFNVPWPQDQRDKANPAYRQRIHSGKPSGAGRGQMDEIYPYCHYVDTLTSSDLPCTVQEANAMQANGTLHAYTHSRLFRLRRRGLDAACASGQALGRQLQAGFGLDSRPDFERLWKARFGTPMEINNMVGNRAEGRKYVEETFPAILQSRPRGLFSRLVRAFK